MELCLQFNVRANDLGSPQLTSNTVPVTITVIRNTVPPVFMQEPYSADITTGFFQGASIIQVTATDADQSVRNYMFLHSFKNVFSYFIIETYL